MPKQKMRIIDEQFSDYTGLMFRVPFTKSVSDVEISESLQSRLQATFRSEMASSDGFTISETTNMTLVVGSSLELSNVTIEKIVDNGAFSFQDNQIKGLAYGSGYIIVSAAGTYIQINVSVLDLSHGGNGSQEKEFSSSRKVGETLDMSGDYEITNDTPDLVSFSGSVLTFTKPGTATVRSIKSDGQIVKYTFTITES